MIVVVVVVCDICAEMWERFIQSWRRTTTCAGNNFRNPSHKFWILLQGAYPSLFGANKNMFCVNYTRSFTSIRHIIHKHYKNLRGAIEIPRRRRWKIWSHINVVGCGGRCRSRQTHVVLRDFYYMSHMYNLYEIYSKHTLTYHWKKYAHLRSPKDLLYTLVYKIYIYRGIIILCWHTPFDLIMRHSCNPLFLFWYN